jgi:hypothetical protein
VLFLVVEELSNLLFGETLCSSSLLTTKTA